MSLSIQLHNIIIVVAFQAIRRISMCQDFLGKRISVSKICYFNMKHPQAESSSSVPLHWNSVHLGQYVRVSHLRVPENLGSSVRDGQRHENPARTSSGRLLLVLPWQNTGCRSLSLSESSLWLDHRFHPSSVPAHSTRLPFFFQSSASSSSRHSIATPSVSQISSAQYLPMKLRHPYPLKFSRVLL